jgi:glycosyltransferase involved in cell wall biosynthesis
VRILHVATRHRRGGAERNLIHTALWEARQGHDVHLAIGRDSLPEDVPPGLAVHVIPSLVRAVSPLDDVKAYLGLRRLIRDVGFSVVHTHQSKAGILGRLAARGSEGAVVHTIHMASFGPAYGSANSAAFVRAERICAGWTDVIVSVGDELRRIYLSGSVGRLDQYATIRSPIDIAAFRALRGLTAGQRMNERTLLGLDASHRVAIIIASLEPRKRVDLVVRALAPILRTGELNLVIAGDGPERNRVTSLAAELGVADSIRVLGHVTDIRGLLSVADVLVHASTVEGVPQVTIQAFAAGVPVVATEMIGLREVAGAPVRIVAASGAGLGEAVREVLRNEPPPVPAEALDAWSPDGVDRSLADLHERLGVLMRSRAGKPAR